MWLLLHPVRFNLRQQGVGLVRSLYIIPEKSVFLRLSGIFVSSFRYNPIDDPRFELLKGKSAYLDENERKVIDLVVNTFGLYGGKVLESITHEENPWNDAREGYSDNEPSQEEISQEAIKNYFVGVRKKYDLDTEAGIMNYIRNMLTQHRLFSYLLLQ